MQWMHGRRGGRSKMRRLRAIICNQNGGSTNNKKHKVEQHHLYVSILVAKNKSYSRTLEMTEHKDTIASEVLSASLGGAVSASILFPLEVLKTKMQTEDNGEEDGEKEGMVEYAKKLYAREGPSVYFNGIETSAFQSAMEKAFYFFAYTALKQVHQLIRSISNPSMAGKPIGGFTNLALGW